MVTNKKFGVKGKDGIHGEQDNVDTLLPLPTPQKNQERIWKNFIHHPSSQCITIVVLHRSVN